MGAEVAQCVPDFRDDRQSKGAKQKPVKVYGEKETRCDAHLAHEKSSSSDGRDQVEFLNQSQLPFL